MKFYYTGKSSLEFLIITIYVLKDNTIFYFIIDKTLVSKEIACVFLVFAKKRVDVI